MTQTANPGPGDLGPQGSTAAAATKESFTPRDIKGVGLHIGTHSQEMFFSMLAVVLAAVGAILIAFPSLHILGGWTSLAGIVVGLYAQLTSDTTQERMVNVVAIGVSAVAFAFNLHHGGLF